MGEEGRARVGWEPRFIAIRADWRDLELVDLPFGIVRAREGKPDRLRGEARSIDLG
jgi:hypothetical protein